MPTVSRFALVLGSAVALAANVAEAQVFAPTTGGGVPAHLTFPCVIPPELASFQFPLARIADRLAARQPIKLIAIGSSSTYGEGASSPEASYPSRLETELNDRFRGQRFTVVNRGINGDTDRDKRDRFERDVIAERPDAVLWQLGTNSMLTGDPMDTHLPILQGGVDHLSKATGADIVLIDPQYAPKVINAGRADTVVNLIAETAQGTRVNLFRRYDLMRHWREVERMSFNKFLSADEFHMNDWSYACVARALGTAIAEAATRPGAPAIASTPSMGSSGRQ